MTKELFSEKYCPKDIKSYTGFNHQPVLQYIEKVISEKEKKKAIIFHGLPGTGKTTLANMLPNHFGIFSFYSNASDLRKKKDINADIFRTTSLQSKKTIIIFDEVDGLSKSAFKELEKVLKKYTQPTILICNDLQKIPYNLRSICHVEKFTVDRFSMLALANKVVKAENLELSRDEIKKIVDNSKSYRNVLHDLQFGIGSKPHGQLSTDDAVLSSLQGRSEGISTTNLADTITRFNDNSNSPNLISLADLWESRYRGGYTFGKYVVVSILGTIRNPQIKKLEYPRTYALTHEAKTGKKREEHSKKRPNKTPKIRILGFK